MLPTPHLGKIEAAIKNSKMPSAAVRRLKTLILI